MKRQIICLCVIWASIYGKKKKKKHLNIVRGSCLFFAYSSLLREMQLAFDADDFKQSIAKIMKRGECEKRFKKKKKGLRNPKCFSPAKVFP